MRGDATRYLRPSDADTPVQAGLPVEFLIHPLQADTKYFYRFHPRLAGASQFTISPEDSVRPRGLRAAPSHSP